MSAVIPVLSERLYDFSSLGSSVQTTVVLVKAIDVAMYRSGTLNVRVHLADYGAGSPTLQVVAYVTAPSCDEPDVDFIGDAKATVVLKDGSTDIGTGELGRDDLTASFASHLRIVLEATQASTMDTLQATISAELVLDEEPTS